MKGICFFLLIYSIRNHCLEYIFTIEILLDECVLVQIGRQAGRGQASGEPVGQEPEEPGSSVDASAGSLARQQKHRPRFIHPLRYTNLPFTY